MRSGLWLRKRCQYLLTLTTRLTPLDAVSAHAWLFDNRPELPNPLPALSTPPEDQDNQLYEAQWDAIRAVYAQGGVVSIARMAEEATLSLTVGYAVSRALESDAAISLALPHIGGESPQVKRLRPRGNGRFLLSVRLGASRTCT